MGRFIWYQSRSEGISTRGGGSSALELSESSITWGETVCNAIEGSMSGAKGGGSAKQSQKS